MCKADKKNSDFTFWSATRFYIPLVIQAASQSLTYPLVASIVSHGERGVVDLAAFAQGQAVMFLIGALGGGLITTGMVFGKDAKGHASYTRLNLAICLTLAFVQGLVVIPPFDHLVFNNILGLPLDMQRVAREVLLLCIPMQIFFFLRNPALVALYNARESAMANWATMSRIILTAMCTPLFVRCGLTGHRMGVVAMSLPLLLEVLLVNWFARKHIRTLPQTGGQSAGMKTQLAFTAPLSLGGVLMAGSSFMIGAFIARAPEPARMLPIHYVTRGIVNPVSFAAIRMQAVVLAFPPRKQHDNRVFRFAICAGIILALIQSAGLIPVVTQWYFGAVQNVPAGDIPLAVRAMLVMVLYPFVQALRGHVEGMAALRKMPNAILAGQAMNLATLISVLFITLHLGMPGYMMGVVATISAVTMSLLTIHLGLWWADMETRRVKTLRKV